MEQADEIGVCADHSAVASVGSLNKTVSPGHHYRHGGVRPVHRARPTGVAVLLACVACGPKCAGIRADLAVDVVQSVKTGPVEMTGRGVAVIGITSRVVSHVDSWAEGIL